VIKQLHPTSGPTEGGSVIEVRGKNFVPVSAAGEFNCRFQLLSDEVSEIKYVPAHYQSEEVVICIAPGGFSQGAEAEVELTMNGNDYTDFKQKFNYFKIDGITPQSGPASGSQTPITITGSGFKNAKNATLLVNNTPAKLKSFGDDFVSFEMPDARYGEGFTG
jgi:hypothetical protein